MVQFTQYFKPEAPPTKRVRFGESTKPPASTSNNNDDQDFQIGSEVIYTKNGSAQNVVYEGVDRNGVNHYIRHKDGSRSLVSRSALSLLSQISFSNISIDINGETPESKFYGIPLETIPVKPFHT